MVDFKDILSKCRGFQWYTGNLEKNWLKHRVSRLEIEQVFFNRPLLVAFDDQHSQEEQRFFALGRTEFGRRLFMVFTVRHDMIRVTGFSSPSLGDGRLVLDNQVMLLT